MEITIMADGRKEEEPLILTNEGLANDYFVTIAVGLAEYIVPLQELFVAVSAFEMERKLRLMDDLLIDGR